MASLRNAVRRREHRERAQPRHRARLGLLEKHKDYKQRARHYNRKNDRLRALKEKASFKNPDEFYFGMAKTSTKGGVHTLSTGEQLTEEQLKVFKTQDSAFVRHKRSADMRKAEKLRASLSFVDAGGTMNKHTVFVDTEEEAQSFDVAEHFDTAAGHVWSLDHGSCTCGWCSV